MTFDAAAGPALVELPMTDIQAALTRAESQPAATHAPGSHVILLLPTPSLSPHGRGVNLRAQTNQA